MTTYRLFVFVSALVLSMVVAASHASAQPKADRPRQAAGITNGELIRMLDTYAIVRAQDALGLDDAHYGQFVTRLKKLQETRRRGTQARNQILRELGRLTAPSATPDENAIRDRLRALREHDDRAAADLRRAYDALDEILDPRQQARFRVFEEQIERRKLDLLMRVRDRGRGAAPSK